ncbi:MAG: Cholera toxin secretion protein epsF [Pseudomonadota bacterium]|jgi:general secretion pathway protein F
MPAFRFEAAHADGRIERGTIDADSQRHARALLRERGLAPLDVVGLQQAGPGQTTATLGRRMSAADLALATRQLASLLSARLPLEQALGVVIEQAERRSVRERFAAVRAEVLGGQTLAGAMARMSGDFPEIYRAMVDAGEQSGDLAQVMERLADHVESRTALAQKVGLAFIYPLVVTGVASLVIIVLLTYVVPQVTEVFMQSGQTLPALTVALIAVSDFIRQQGQWLLLAALLTVLVIRLVLRAPTVRLAWHRRQLRLPVIGRLVRGVQTARFASTLAILVSSGVPLIRALEAGARTLSNEALRDNVHDGIGRVREGVPLARALAAAQQFPPMLVHLVASGEATGRLPEMLDRAAATLSAEAERRTLTLTSLLEPLLILVMGGIVLLIVLAVMLPIIEINQLVR